VLGKIKAMLISEDAEKFPLALKVLHKSFHSSAAMTGPTTPLYIEVRWIEDRSACVPKKERGGRWGGEHDWAHPAAVHRGKTCMLLVSTS